MLLLKGLSATGISILKFLNLSLFILQKDIQGLCGQDLFRSKALKGLPALSHLILPRFPGILLQQ